MEIGGLTLFILVLFFGAFSILFGLPGTLVILIDAAVYAAVTGFERIGFKILITLLLLSILAELADFAVGMAGAVKFGASRRSFWVSVVGSLIGAALLALAEDRMPASEDLGSLRVPMRAVLLHHLGGRGLKSWEMLGELGRLAAPKP